MHMYPESNGIGWIICGAPTKGGNLWGQAPPAPPLPPPCAMIISLISMIYHIAVAHTDTRSRYYIIIMQYFKNSHGCHIIIWLHFISESYWGRSSHMT